MEELNFVQSTSDPCLFISPTIICLIYVDDALFVYREESDIEALTVAMKRKKMIFEVEDDVAGYLGVHIDRDTENGTITLTQKGLTDRIIEALHLDDDTPSVKTPSTEFLAIDEIGEGPLELFDYASVNGMLQYLQGHTRPDISFSVSQTSRYVHSPKTIP